MAKAKVLKRKLPPTQPKTQEEADQRKTAAGLETTDPNYTYKADGTRVEGTASSVVTPRSGPVTHVRTPKGVAVATFTPGADVAKGAKHLPDGHTVYTMSDQEAARYEGNNNNGERDGVLAELKARFEGNRVKGISPTSARSLTQEEADQLDPYKQANRTGLLDDVLNPIREVPYANPQALPVRARIDANTGLPYPDAAYRERANPDAAVYPRVTPNATSAQSPQTQRDSEQAKSKSAAAVNAGYPRGAKNAAPK